MVYSSYTLQVEVYLEAGGNAAVWDVESEGV